MLKHLRQQIVNHLWHQYCLVTPQMQQLQQALKMRGIHKIPLDHFAVIDLPGSHTGIPHLAQIFSAIGYIPQGRDYLADKQNEFMWMTEIDSIDSPAIDALPQVVNADFWLDEMPVNIRRIIEKYSRQANPSPVTDIHKLIGRVYLGDGQAAAQVIKMICDYFKGREWPLPTLREFLEVREFNELLAWVLIFGRQPNHFTISAHLLPIFSDIHQFNHFIEYEAGLTLNRENGVIKGNTAAGIEQCATTNKIQTIQLADGEINLPLGFIEYVWRHPRHATCTKPTLWSDYFTGFIAQQANKVVEALYVTDHFASPSHVKIS